MSRPTSILSLVTFFALLAVLVPAANAWGKNGHGTVGELAVAMLPPAAQAKINAIVAFAGSNSLYTNVFDAANFPDLNRTAGGSTFSSHFINFDDAPTEGKCSGSGANMTIPADCNGDKSCITTALGKFTQQLATSAPESMTAAFSLALVMHFAGDISQPLHATGFKLGANQVNVTFAGAQTNLHSTWDTALVDKAIAASSDGTRDGWKRDVANKASPTSAGTRCISRADPKNAAAITNCAVQWATDSELLVCREVFGSAFSATADLSDAYAAREVPVVNKQIAKASLRLASILCKIFGGEK
ncbi:S1/P1 nuclease [Blastocladiella britannica]|nr:S1/P1 nuclease [Blastocladiella britannica]